MDLPQAKESGRAATCLRALWASRGAEAAPASVRSCVLAAGAARHGQHPPAGGCSLKPMLVPAAAATRLLGQRLDFALQLCYVGGIWPCNRKRAPGQRHRQAAACVTAPAPPHINATLHAAVAMRLESVQDVCSNRNLPARYEFSSFTSASLRGLYCLPSIVSIFVVIRRKLPKKLPRGPAESCRSPSCHQRQPCCAERRRGRALPLQRCHSCSPLPQLSDRYKMYF